jgi:hypothetical protein
MEEGIYYRQGGRLTHASCEMLPNGKDIERIVIERIEYKDSESINGRVETGVWLAHFARNRYTELPMVLNATNRKRIAKQFWDTKVEDGTPCEGRINLLKNIPVRLTKELTRDVQDGGQTYGLRVSKIPASPEQARKALPLEKVEAVAAWAKGKGYGFAEVSGLYEMDTEVSDALRGALEA